MTSSATTTPRRNCVIETALRTPHEYLFSVRADGTRVYVGSSVLQFGCAGDALAYVAAVLGYSDIDKRSEHILDVVADRLREEVTK